VYCRVRPLTREEEASEGKDKVRLDFIDSDTVCFDKKRYTFDRVFRPEHQQGTLQILLEITIDHDSRLYWRFSVDHLFFG
jgi:hypothetical protein